MFHTQRRFRREIKRLCQIAADLGVAFLLFAHTLQGGVKRSVTTTKITFTTLAI